MEEKIKIKAKNKNKDKRMYFRQYDECCYPIQSHLKFMVENGINEMEIFLAKRETNSYYFFCKHLMEVADKSEGGCGKMCEAYKPRNGKSGVCSHYGYVYEQTDRSFILKIVKLKLEENGRK